MFYCGELQYMYVAACSRAVAHVPVKLLQCRVQFSCQGLLGFVPAFPAWSNHVRTEWCNVGPCPVLIAWLYQPMHAHRDPTRKLTKQFYGRCTGQQDFLGEGILWWIGSVVQKYIFFFYKRRKKIGHTQYIPSKPNPFQNVHLQAKISNIITIISYHNPCTLTALCTMHQWFTDL